MQIPERLINFRAYSGPASLELLGMTDVELPAFESMVETIMGAGIAGEYSSPVLGHFGSQKVKLKWRTVTAAMIALITPVRTTFDIRGSIQLQDPMLGQLITQPVRVECTGQVTSQNYGKLEPGKVMGVETDVEIAKIKIDLNGVNIIELDKFNMIFRVNGVDYLQPVRQDMGGV